MLKTILVVLGLIGLIVAQSLVIENSERIAIALATVPYQTASDEELGIEPLPPTKIDAYGFTEGVILRSHTEHTNAAKRKLHYRDYISTHVSPVESRVVLFANLAFGLAFVGLIVFAITNLSRWLHAGGGLAGRLGLAGTLRRRQLGRAETEFAQLKSLFDNGLLTEAEFLARKSELASKIRNDSLPPKG